MCETNGNFQGQRLDDYEQEMDFKGEYVKVNCKYFMQPLDETARPCYNNKAS